MYEGYIMTIDPDKEIDRCRDSEILGLLATIGIGNTQGGQV